MPKKIKTLDGYLIFDPEQEMPPSVAKYIALSHFGTDGVADYKRVKSSEQREAWHDLPKHRVHFIPVSDVIARDALPSRVYLWQGIWQGNVVRVELIGGWDSARNPAFHAAIAGERPMRWRPMGRYEYLLGAHIWEVSTREQLHGEEELRLLFLDAVDAERRRFERLRSRFDGEAGKPKTPRQRIPEEVRIFVWRRDEGRCVRCGSVEHLEFDHIIPVSKGGSSTTRNVQLLCENCNRSKGASL